MFLAFSHFPLKKIAGFCSANTHFASTSIIYSMMVIVQFYTIMVIVPV